MARIYKCRDCGVERAHKWTGRCPGCGRYFNIIHTVSSALEGDAVQVEEGEVVSLCDVSAIGRERLPTTVEGVDIILGTDPTTGKSGIAKGAGHVIQIYGSPGSGKSTLLLQVCQGLGKQRYKVLYVAGEETPEQIKARADRVGKFNSLVLVIRDTELDGILNAIEDNEPDVVIVDSLNSVSVEDYATGSVMAASIAAREITKLVKDRGIGMFLVVQITKSGDFSGAKAVEHLVDTSLFLRNRGGKTRSLECTTKNRFNSTPFYSYFTMTDKGLSYLYTNDGSEDPDEDEKSDENDEDKTPIEKPKKSPTRKLKSVPKEPGQVDKPSKKKPKKSQAKLKIVHDDSPLPSVISQEWSSPDGISAKVVLEVNCDVDGCRGQKGRACSSSSGVREVGFHTSRIEKSKLATKVKVDDVKHAKEVESVGDDPFKKRFGSPPKMKPKQKQKQKKRPPEITT